MSSNEEQKNVTNNPQPKTPPRDWRAMASRNSSPLKMSEYLPPAEVMKIIEEAKNVIPADLKDTKP